MISLLRSLILFLLTFSAIGSSAKPIGDTNASRLSRGLPLKKPARTFDATKTVAKRQSPSGAPQLGTMQVTPLNTRKRDGPLYLMLVKNWGAFGTTTDINQATLFMSPGGSPYSDQEIQYYNTDTLAWQNVAGLQIAYGSTGYSVSVLGPSNLSGHFSATSSGSLSFDYKADKPAYNYRPNLYLGQYYSYPAAVVGALTREDAIAAKITDPQPCTLTFVRND